MPRRRSRGSSLPVKLIKGTILLGPVAAKAISAADSNGGLFSKNGLVKGALPAITTSYSGINTNDGKFYAQDLVTGWGPVGAVLIGEKLGVFRIIGRVFR